MKRTAILLLACILLAFYGCNTPDYDNNGGYDEPATYNKTMTGRSRMVNCPLCNGTGMWNLMPGDAMAYVKCNLCNGSGQMTEEEAYAYMEAGRKIQQMSTPRGTSTSGWNQNGYNPPKCPICHGSGRCDVCAGRGWKTYVNGYAEDCTRCRGTGQCQSCYGRGLL